MTKGELTAFSRKLLGSVDKRMDARFAKRDDVNVHGAAADESDILFPKRTPQKRSRNRSLNVRMHTVFHLSSNSIT